MACKEELSWYWQDDNIEILCCIASCQAWQYWHYLLHCHTTQTTLLQTYVAFSVVQPWYQLQSAHYWFLTEMVKILTFFWPNFDINADQNLTFLNINSDFELTNEENSNIILYSILNTDYSKVTFIVNKESKSKNLTFLVKFRPFSDQFCQKVRISDHFRKSRPQ